MTDISDPQATPKKPLESLPTPPLTAGPEDGTASSLRQARALAERYHMNLVDLAVTNVDPEASKVVPLHVLEHVCAIPFAFDGSSVRVAITDPQNVRGLDEIRLATRHRVEFFVAARDDVLTELRRLTRDDSLVQELLDRGHLTEEQARAHPQRSLVLQALDGRARASPRP